jgi:peptidoglycan/xylan/chitin deacetylase (PgdA/CDA1 family)
VRAILTYHSIDGSDSPISIPEARFRAHMDWLAGSGVRVVSLPELLRLESQTNAVALTFDDGFLNFAEIAWPILKSHGFPATLFVVTDRTGSTNEWGNLKARTVPTLPLLDWTELARLAEEGVTLGSHTRTHPNLRAISTSALIDEVEGAAARLYAETGERALTFAYPYGAFDREIAAVVGSTHSIACTTELRPLGAAENALLLPRLDAYYFRRPGTLESWGSSAFRRYVWLRAHARRVRQAFVTPGAPA